MMVSIRDEYEPTFGRQNLTLWTGPFADVFDGWARELPGHNGFMIELYGGMLSGVVGKIRVECESPRTDENYQRVDEALAKAAEEARDLLYALRSAS